MSLNRENDSNSFRNYPTYFYLYKLMVLAVKPNNIHHSQDAGNKLGGVKECIKLFLRNRNQFLFFRNCLF